MVDAAPCCDWASSGVVFWLVGLDPNGFVDWNGFVAGRVETSSRWGGLGVVVGGGVVAFPPNHDGGDDGNGLIGDGTVSPRLIWGKVL